MTGTPSSKGVWRGDIMSPEDRSRVMSRIKGKNTSLELKIATRLSDMKISWEPHVKSLPGCPDFGFRQARVAVFVDGDFWHGWRFPQWMHKLSPKWAEKIGKNRQRDTKNYRKLRDKGWKVLRVWEHQLIRDPDGCMNRILSALSERLSDDSWAAFFPND